jgi:hypothetical protein
MGILQLNKDYRVETDERNFILQQLRIVQDKESVNYGKEQWDVIGYFASFSALISALTKRNLLVLFPDFKAIQGANKELVDMLKKFDGSLNIVE